MFSQDVSYTHYITLVRGIILDPFQHQEKLFVFVFPQNILIEGNVRYMFGDERTSTLPISVQKTSTRTSFCRICRSGEVYVGGVRIRIILRLNPAPFHRVCYPCVQTVAPRAALHVQTIRPKFTRVKFPDPKELASKGRRGSSQF